MKFENQIHLSNFIHYCENNNLKVAKEILKSVMMDKIKNGWMPSRSCDGSLNFDLKGKTFGCLSSFLDESDEKINISNHFDLCIDYFNSIHRLKLPNQSERFWHLEFLCIGWNGHLFNSTQDQIKSQYDLKLWHEAGKDLYGFCHLTKYMTHDFYKIKEFTKIQFSMIK